MKQKWVSLGRAAAASVVMVWLAMPVQAGVVATYSDRSLWAGSLTSVVTQDFNEALGGAHAGDGYQQYNNSGGNPSSYTTGILQFLGQRGSNFELTRYIDGAETVLKGPAWPGSTTGDPRVVVSLSSAARGFGIDVASSVEGITYQFTIDGEATTTFVAGLTPVFFGVTTDADISQVVIRMVSSGALPGLDTLSRFDNAATGLAGSGGGADPDPSETPEPSTALFLVTGISLLAWTRYRRVSSPLS